MKFIKFLIFLVSILSISSLFLRKHTDVPVNAPLTKAITSDQKTRQSENEETDLSSQDTPLLSKVVESQESTPKLKSRSMSSEQFPDSSKNVPYKPARIHQLDGSESLPQEKGSGSFNFNVMVGNSNTTISNINVKGI